MTIQSMSYGFQRIHFVMRAVFLPQINIERLRVSSNYTISNSSKFFTSSLTTPLKSLGTLVCLQSFLAADRVLTSFFPFPPRRFGQIWLLLNVYISCRHNMMSCKGLLLHLNLQTRPSTGMYGKHVK